MLELRMQMLLLDLIAGRHKVKKVSKRISKLDILQLRRIHSLINTMIKEIREDEYYEIFKNKYLYIFKKK